MRFTPNIALRLEAFYRTVATQRNAVQLCCEYLASINFFVSPRSCRKKIKQIIETDSYCRKYRGGYAKISRRDLKRLHKLVYNNRSITVVRIKQVLNLQHISGSTISRYLKKLGWCKIASKYCQLVSKKNKLRRNFYALLCKRTNEQFRNHLFVDETSIELRFHTYRRWRHRLDRVSDRARLPARSNVKIHCFAGISRQGAISIQLFKGRLKARGVIRLLNNDMFNFMRHHGQVLVMDGAKSHSARLTTQ